MESSKRQSGHSLSRNEVADLIERAKELVEDAHGILVRIDALPKSIDGILKFRKRVVAELEFLQNLVSEKLPMKKHHVSCTNLFHYKAIVARIEAEPNEVVAKGNQRVEVDIVSHAGQRWTKVKAMKASSLKSVHRGTAAYGQKSIIALAKELVACSQLHLVHYQIPKIVIEFTQGVTADVKDELQMMGIVVRGDEAAEDDYEGEYDDSSDSSDVDDESDDEASPRHAPPKTSQYEKLDEASLVVDIPQIVNLDVTALICLVSDVTNGGSHHRFRDQILEDQAQDEKVNPCLPGMLKAMEGKEIVVCQTAWDKFLGIVKIVGGPTELKRTDELSTKIKVVADNPSSEVLALKGPKVKDQHRIIFGTGHALRAMTLTANVSFVRTAAQQDVTLSVYLHPARACTEQKIVRNTCVDQNTTTTSGAES